jgi:hypothetical protein
LTTDQLLGRTRARTRVQDGAVLADHVINRVWKELV